MEKQQGKIPEVRFPEFKDEWEHKKLSELLSESKNLNTDLKYDKDEVLSVSGELGIVNQIEHLGRSYAGESVHNYGVVETGDIVYTKSPLKANPFGIIKLNKGKAGIVSTLYAIYKPKQENAIGEFIDHYFSLDANTNRYLRPLVKKGAKNDMKINNAYVLHDRIFAPSTTEQKRIASFYDVLDKRITQLKKKKALLEEYKKGVMQKIFSQDIRFKDKNGEEFPKWEKRKLGDYIDVISGIALKGEDILEKRNGTPILRGINISEGFIRHNNDIDRFYNGDIEPVKRFLLKENDLVIGMDGSKVGKNSSLVTKNDVGSILIQRVARLRAKSNSNIKFLFQIINSVIFHRYVDTVNTSSGIPHISLKQINDFKITIPCLKEQNKIAHLLYEIDKRLNQCQQQIEQTQEYRKGLIQKMFCV